MRLLPANRRPGMAPCFLGALVAAFLLVPAASALAAEEGSPAIFSGAGEGSGWIKGEVGSEGGVPHIECHWNGAEGKFDVGTSEATGESGEPGLEECTARGQYVGIGNGGGILVYVESDSGSTLSAVELDESSGLVTATGPGCNVPAVSDPEICGALSFAEAIPIEITTTFDLEPPAEPHPLTVHKTGEGQGWIYSEESAEGTPQYAINCGTSCNDKSAEIAGEVTLKASGYNFVEWISCPGTASGRECTAPMAEAEEATAEFTDRSPLSVEKEGSGQGWLYSTGGFAINCGTSCLEKTAFFGAGESVELKASGYEFDSWTECPEGSASGRTCTLPANGQTAKASFTERHALTVNKTGNTNVGWVHSESPAYTINCGNSCATKTGFFEPGSVTLTASGANFVEWTDCEGSPSASRECTIDLSSGDKTAEVEYVE